MDRRKQPRKRKRITCELEFEGRRQRGIVLDISPEGLFVQTDASLTPGAALRAWLRTPDGGEIELSVQVARKRLVPRRLQATVAGGGLGLEVRNAPEAYLALARENRVEEAPAKGAAPEATPAPPGPRFRVRVKQHSGPRSRTLLIHAASAEEARELALREVGEGWDALEAEPA